MTEVVRQLSPEDLTLFVHKVKELCPKAVLDMDSKHLQIKVDYMDKVSFKKIMEILYEKTGNEIYEAPNKKFKDK